MADLRLFGPARQAAGVARVDVPGHSVAEVIGAAEDLYGAAFADIVAGSRIWLNGQTVTGETPVEEGDEVAVVPPVSGG